MFLKSYRDSSYDLGNEGVLEDTGGQGGFCVGVGYKYL